VGIFLVMYDHWLEDENGNGHLEQGEWSDLVVSIGNNGNLTANNVTANLSTASSYINITQPTASFGTLTQNQSAEGTFSFEVDENFPNGDTAFFTVEVIANGGLYESSFNLSFIVGKYPILIIDLDGNHNSGSVMQTIIDDIDLTAHYNTSFPENLDLYKCVFVCLGTYNNNHVLSATEGQALADYLNHGGRLYMEGGDTWAYDSPTAVHPMFKINGLEDGNSDLGIIMGQQGSFAEGLAFPYGGDNSYIDHLAPVDNAFELFRNQVPSYCNAVALDNGDYKTVGCSFEFGGLADNQQNTKEELMILILEFFGGILTGTEEYSMHAPLEVRAWPNPSHGDVNFSVAMSAPGNLDLSIYDIRGEILYKNIKMNLQAGIHQLEWNGCTSLGSVLPPGMYFYRMQINGRQTSGKLILAD